VIRACRRGGGHLVACLGGSKPGKRFGWQSQSRGVESEGEELVRGEQVGSEREPTWERVEKQNDKREREGFPRLGKKNPRSLPCLTEKGSSIRAGGRVQTREKGIIKRARTALFVKPGKRNN